ncbi:MAG TPA: phospho-N-acetylmuramoyl-pentapeptide-transferase [Capsulimonadaceae bacterium]|jgi:phospho-N-acetylmuramoyl-pentapeptide-transferase
MIKDIPIASLAFFASFLSVLLAGPKVIAFMHRLKYGQTINSYLEESHKAKQGTPTMGGILFLIGVAVSLIVSIVCVPAVRATGMLDILVLALVFVLHMAIGFTDDYLSIKRGKNLGLKAREKLVAQIVIAFSFAFYIFANSPADGPREMMIGPDHVLRMPQMLYAFLVGILMISMSNFTNLTDGLDGLASGLGLLVVTGLAAYASYMHPEVALFGWALAGSLVGFLVYNGNPAKIFMGDTGSLALGSTFTAMAILARSELVFLAFSLVFIAEGLSVVLQVASFKTTGKRIFLMSPLHHHFEKLGWTESRIVLRFWIAGIISLWLGMLLEQRF